MERIIDFVLTQINNNFDFSYMIVINILTYILIKILDYINKEKPVYVWQKRVILFIAIIIVSTIYIYSGYDNKIILVNSAIVTPISWSWIFRPIVTKLGIGYKQNK